MRLYELGSAIAALTAGDMIHVNRLDARFLQILEDAGPAWMVAVLYGPAAQNITTREVLKNLLTTTDPGGAVSVSEGLDALAREAAKCWKCGMFGHFARDFPHARDCPQHWPDCPKEAGAGMHRSATLNMLSVQQTSQEHHTLIAAIQNQVSLQHQLLAAQATLAPLASLTAQPAVAQVPMILGGYVYFVVGM